MRRTKQWPSFTQSRRSVSSFLACRIHGSTIPCLFIICNKTPSVFLIWFPNGAAHCTVSYLTILLYLGFSCWGSDFRNRDCIGQKAFYRPQTLSVLKINETFHWRQHSRWLDKPLPSKVLMSFPEILLKLRQRPWYFILTSDLFSEFSCLDPYFTKNVTYRKLYNRMPLSLWISEGIHGFMTLFNELFVKDSPHVSFVCALN